MKGPLDGILVLDWTIGQNGPVAAMLLGDLGANVIKIEPPVVGDAGRGFDQIMGRMLTGLPEGRNFYWECNNRNKRGITLDLKKEEGRQVLYKMATKADIFLHNYRKGVAERVGADYKSLCQYNPKLIYIWANALGTVGPDAYKPGNDLVAQARSGVMTAVGEPDMPPLYLLGGFADQTGGIMTAMAALSALTARERFGIGQEVHTSLLGAMIESLALNVMAVSLLGQTWQKQHRKLKGNPLWNWYQCADGKWIVLAMIMQDRAWPDFCRVMGIQELQHNPKFENAGRRKENAGELVSILDGLFAQKTRAEWSTILDAASRQGADILYEVVNTIEDLTTDPQVLANGYITNFDHPAFGNIQVVGPPFTLTKTPMSIRREAPTLGQHTEEVLLEFGYTWDDITGLRDREAI